MLRTNTKIVNQRIEEHVKEYYPNIEDLQAALRNVLSFGTTYQRGAELAKGGCFLCYLNQVSDFLKDTLEETQEEADKYFDKSWDLYCHLIGKACARLVEIMN